MVEPGACIALRPPLDSPAIHSGAFSPQHLGGTLVDSLQPTPAIHFLEVRAMSPSPHGNIFFGLDGDVPPTRWLWHGLLAPGKLTLLTSLWKSGKTTLLAHLLARRRCGGDFLGLPVTPGVSLV